MMLTVMLTILLEVRILSILDEAISEVDKLKSGEKFFVKDLFKGYLWNRLSLNDRRNLG